MSASSPAISKVVLEEGAQIVADPNEQKPMTMLGHVTSAYWSENLGRSIAFALVAGGRERMGKTLYVPDARQDNRRRGDGSGVL